MSRLGTELRKAAAGLRAWTAPRGSVVLAYHRIADVPLDPSRLAVSPANFGSQVDALAARARVLSLPEAVRAARSGADPGVVLTFDDGYRDNLVVASPLLATAGLRATVFVPAEAVDRTHGFWWDDLEGIAFRSRTLPERLELTLAGKPVAWEAGGPIDRGELDGTFRSWCVWRDPPATPRQDLYRRLWSVFLKLDTDARREAMEGLLAAGFDRPPNAHPTLTRDELATLIGEGTFELGAHTRTHPWLAGLSERRQRAEVVDGTDELAAAAGVRPRSFSYPFGAYDDVTVGVVRDVGFEVACTTEDGVLGSRTDPLRVPRFMVGNWSGPTLIRRLPRHLVR